MACRTSFAVLSLCGANTHRNAEGIIFNQSSSSQVLTPPSDVSDLEDWPQLRAAVSPSQLQGIRSLSLPGNVHWKLKQEVQIKVTVLFRKFH